MESLVWGVMDLEVSEWRSERENRNLCGTAGRVSIGMTGLGRYSVGSTANSLLEWVDC